MTRLTVRERQLVDQLTKGLTNKQIARAMNITEGTVKMMLHRLYSRYGIGNRLALALLVVETFRDHRPY